MKLTCIFQLFIMLLGIALVALSGCGLGGFINDDGDSGLGTIKAKINGKNWEASNPIAILIPVTVDEDGNTIVQLQISGGSVKILKRESSFIIFGVWGNSISKGQY